MKKPKFKEFVKNHNREIIASSITAGAFLVGAFVYLHKNAYFEVPKGDLEKLLTTQGGGILFEHAGRKLVLIAESLPE